MNKKNVLVSHPTGNANVRAAVDGFRKAGLLESFHTTVACRDGGMLYRLAAGPLRDFRRRAYGAEVYRYTYTYPWKELGRMAARRLGIQRWAAHETGCFCIDRVCRDLDERVARYVERNRADLDAVYAYEDCALETFREAHACGKACLYDLPIGHWRAMRELWDEESRRNPEWAMTLGGMEDSVEKLIRKDCELAEADRIYVASSFTKKTLEVYPGNLNDIEVIPYGFPPVNAVREYRSFDGRKIKVLFVGGLSQRKGISYLFDALKGFEGQMELTVVGRKPEVRCGALEAALAGIRHIPSLAHGDVLAVMAAHDVLVFPSLFEGFGLVVTEAMSQGTPVVTTERTCGPDIITSGKDGWIVPAGEAAPLKALLAEFAARPEMLAEAGREAMRTAARRPWACYERELSESVMGFLNGK